MQHNQNKMRYYRGKQLLTMWPYYAAAIVAVALCWLANHFLLGMTVDYESDNHPAPVPVSEGTEVFASYSFYLDTSPSMLGYATLDGRMSIVAQALRAVSSRRGSSRFSYYLCAEKVENVSETEFFNNMSDSTAQMDRYQDALADNEMQELVDRIDPSLIFSGS